LSIRVRYVALFMAVVSVGLLATSGFMLWAQQGAIPAYMASGPLAADLVRESADWVKIIKSQKISVE